jgi:hypothetical protein
MFCWGDTFARRKTSFGTAPSMSLDEGKSGRVPRMALGLTNRRCEIPQIFGTIGRDGLQAGEYFYCRRVRNPPIV